MLKADLRILVGKHQGKLVPLLTNRFLIGREQDCHLRPNSDMVSRHHCVLSIDDYSVRIRDLGSTNGTRVNGQLVRGELVLKSGDKLVIGNLQVELVLGTGTRTPASPNASTSAAPPLPATDQISEPPSVLISPEMTETTLDTHYEMVVNPLVQAETPSNVAPDTAIFPPNSQFPGSPLEAHSAAPAMANVPGYPAGYPVGYPQQMPVGYPPQMAGFPAGYGMPQNPYAMPPGYGMMPGYGMPHPGAGYPMGMPGQGFEPQVEEQPIEEVKAPAAIPLRLPKPEETGLRTEAAPPPPPAGANGEAPPVKPSQKAADIIKQYLNRRGGEKEKDK